MQKESGNELGRGMVVGEKEGVGVGVVVAVAGREDGGGHQQRGGLREWPSEGVVVVGVVVGN